MCSVDELVREYLEVVDGVLVWRRSPARKIKAGQVAGTLRPDGYVAIKLMGHRLMAHRVVMFLHTGAWPKVVDHINGNKQDNRPENLRECTHSQNSQNAGKTKSNTSGVKGLGWYAPRGVWQGQIQHNKKRYVYHNADRQAVEDWLVTTRARLAGEFAHD